MALERALEFARAGFQWNVASCPHTYAALAPQHHRRSERILLAQIYREDNGTKFPEFGQ